MRGSETRPDRALGAAKGRSPARGASNRLAVMAMTREERTLHEWRTAPDGELMKKCDEIFAFDELLNLAPKAFQWGCTYLVERGTRPGLNAALAWSAGALITPPYLSSLHR